jgi:hypothetical protein
LDEFSFCCVGYFLGSILFLLSWIFFGINSVFVVVDILFNESVVRKFIFLHEVENSLKHGMKSYFLLFDVRYNFGFVPKMGIVQECQLSGVRLIDLMDDDVSGKSCGTVEYPLVTAINYGLRNNKIRSILTETTENSG